MADDIKIEYIEIEKLRPSEYNPRKATEKQEKDLEESIKRFGVVDPIICNSAPSRENIIIGGHFRYKILKKLGWKTVPVVYIRIDDIEKEKELNLRLNRNLGEWDLELLKQFTQDILKDVGFTNEEMDDIFGIQIDENFDVEKELQKKMEKGDFISQPGDIWKCGEHLLLVGDAVNKENWERLLGDERIDLLLTDPPYNISYTKRIRKQRKKNGMVKRKNRIYLSVGHNGVPQYEQWMGIAKQYEGEKGMNVMIFEMWERVRELWDAVEKFWKVKNLIILHIPRRCQGFTGPYLFFNKYDIAIEGGNGEENFEYEKEMVTYLMEKGSKIINSYDIAIYGMDGEPYFDRRKKTEWMRITDHITHTDDIMKQSIVFGVKPVAVLLPYIKILSPRGGIVVDCFGGSGSTMIACEVMKRKARLIEKFPIYADLIISRYEHMTKIKPERINK